MLDGKTSQQNGDDANRHGMQNRVISSTFQLEDGRRRDAVDESYVNSAQREKWSQPFEFLLSCLGYAIGLSNIWRFPYVYYKSGGGAFLIPYFIMLILCGVPLLFMEMCLGQFCSLGAIDIFCIAPVFKGVGISMVVISSIVSSYYNVIIAYSLMYFYQSIGKSVPWEHCGNPWNSPYCIELQNNSAITNSSLYFNITSATFKTTPSDEYFHRSILKISDGIDNQGALVWEIVFFSFIAWTIVFLCIIKGVKSVGKVVYFTAIFPVVLILILLVRGVTLPGANKGLLYFIKPQWEQLANVKVWGDAAVQIFYSLGPGWGGLVTMSSYNEFRHKSYRDAIIVCVFNSIASILGGIVVFSVLGFMSHQTGLPIDKVVTGGPSLIFVTYPEAISFMPIAPLWAVLFFFMIFIFIMVEICITAFIDHFPKLKKFRTYITLGFCLTLFTASLSCVTNGGIYTLTLLDWYSASFSVILACFFEVCLVAYVYGSARFHRDIIFMLKTRITAAWHIAWFFINPCLLIFIFIIAILGSGRVVYGQYQYPDWCIVLGWFICSLSIVCIPLYGLYYVMKSTGPLKKKLREGITPSLQWGPANASVREEWKNLIAKNSHRNKWIDISYDPIISD